MSRIVRKAVALLLAIVVTVGSASACPTCKTGLEGDPQGQRIARGYFYSILFMMSVPFAMVGAFGTYAFVSYRRLQAAREADEVGAAASAAPNEASGDD